MSAYIDLPKLSEFVQTHRFALATAAACAIGGYLIYRYDPHTRYRTASKAPRKKDFRSDVVYLYTFPPLETVVNISPYALKVETWLRMKGVPFEAIREGGTKYWSEKGQIPFVELNGKEINDSGVIVRELANKFGKPDELSTEQKAISHGFGRMLDNHTSISYFYYRYVEVAKEFAKMWTFVPPFARKMIAWRFPASFRKRAFEHGIGRNSPSEIYALGCEDFQALSDFLGDQKFLYGDQMTSLDCALFAHLTQILYIPLDYPHAKFVRQNCPNLVLYADRLKQDLYPDWDQICSTAKRQ